MNLHTIARTACLLAALAPALAAAQETPRTMEPPPATAERDSQLAPMAPAARTAQPADDAAAARAREAQQYPTAAA